MTKFKNCAVQCHPHWTDVNGQCQGFAITMYLLLSPKPPADRQVILDSVALAMISRVQTEHMANPIEMPSVLSHYDAIPVAATRLSIAPHVDLQVSNQSQLAQCLDKVVASETLTIMTLVSRDYPGHTFLIDGRNRLDEIWLYDSHLPQLVTPLGRTAITQSIQRYTLAKVSQIMATRPDLENPTPFFFEAVTLRSGRMQ